MNVAIADGLTPVNHIFVDFENVQALDPRIFGSKAVTIKLLLGPKQTKLDVTIVESLVANTGSVELVRITAPGKNALDFALAYYVGRAAITDPAGYFHIISKDTGFDPLVQHLRSKNIRAHRHDSFEALTFGSSAKPAATAKPAPPTAPPPSAKPPQSAAALDERASLMLGHLRKQAANPPKRKTTLIKHVIAQLGNKLTEADATGIIGALERAGYLAINDKSQVNYWLEEH